MKALRSWSMVAVAAFLVLISGCNALNDAAMSEVKPEPALIDVAAISAYPLRATYSGTPVGGPMWYRPAWDVIDLRWYVRDYSTLPYHLQQFRVAADGTYVVHSVQDGFDGFLFVYEGAFDPMNQLNGMLAGDDDYSSIRDSLVEVGLVTSKTYFIVTTNFDEFSGSGPFTNYIYGPGAVTLGEADPVEATNDLIADLEQLVEDGVLKSGQAKGLVNPLENALRSLEKEYTADACNQFADFIMEVEAKVPPLSEMQASDLIDSAAAIREMLDCP